MKSLLLLCVGALCLLHAQGACYKDCSCSGSSISCSSSKTGPLEVISDPASYHQYKFEISKSHVTEIPDGSLPGNLVSFFAFYCDSLSYIGDNAFNSSGHLFIRMAFEGNNLTVLPKSLGQVGDSLKYISFKWGRISDISALALAPQSLIYIYLTGNQISDVAAVERGIAGRTNLKKLHIQFNNLDRMPNTAALPTLDEVRVDNNNISYIPEGTFNTNVIKHFWGANNQLTEIPKDFEKVANMFRIVVSGNKIKSLDNYTFTTRLRYLWVDNNEIEEINQIMFTGGHSSNELRWVQMFNNPIKFIKDGAFKYAHGIRRLTLSNTQLTRLPLAVKDLGNLWGLYLNGITNMTCSCDEAALGTWYHHRGPSGMSIGGECTSGVTVTYFLHELAGQCSSA